jgi:hypothetical protein
MSRLNAETASSRSSISSLAACVAPSAMAFGPDAATPTKNPEPHGVRVGSLSNEGQGRKWRGSPFRNPSSVRSMQMQDDDDVIPNHRIRTSRTSRNMSTFSARSSDSVTQTKRRSARNSLLSPKVAKVKKEFPLVLLHCSLLPPAMPIKGRRADVALLQAVLPEEYWRRWELLTDKITNDLEIQSRGVLIPHPKADYEFLEERLLESLELARPKLRSGHYYGIENVDEVEESESDTETATRGTKCRDCGKRVVQDAAHDRKWEVKVYAANGLMRAGAWSAAWNEMEKVDVEVSMCLPDDVRREVEERCLDLGFGQDLAPDEVHAHEPDEAETRRREIYGTPAHTPQEKVDGFFESSHQYEDVHREPFVSQHQYRHGVSTPDIELKQLFINYVKVLAQDKRNMVIAVLSFVVLFFALGTSASPRQGIDQNVMPLNDSTSPLPSVPQCTMNPTSSAPPVLVVQPASSISIPAEPVTTTECGDPVNSAGAGGIDLQGSVPEKTQEAIHEVELES